MAAGQVTRREVQRAFTAVSASSSPGRKLRLCLSVRDGSSGPNGWEIQGEKFQLGTRKNILTELVQGSVFFVTEMFKQRLDKYSRENYRGRDGVAKLEGIDISCQIQDSKILGMKF